MRIVWFYWVVQHILAALYCFLNLLTEQLHVLFISIRTQLIKLKLVLVTKLLKTSKFFLVPLPISNLTCLSPQHSIRPQQLSGRASALSSGVMGLIPSHAIPYQRSITKVPVSSLVMHSTLKRVVLGVFFLSYCHGNGFHEERDVKNG